MPCSTRQDPPSTVAVRRHSAELAPGLAGPLTELLEGLRGDSQDHKRRDVRITGTVAAVL